MSGLIDIAIWAKELDERLPQAVSDVAVAVAIAIVDDLALITPVDTGTAMSNWQVTLDSPAVEEIPAYSPSKAGEMLSGGRYVHSVDPDATRAANYPLVLDNAALTLADKRPGQDIYITNVVGTDREPESYIKQLDKGTSPQFIGDFLGREALVAERVLETQSILI